jgi:3-dehydroquinate synthase
MFQEIAVNLEKNSYQILIGKSALSRLPNFLDQKNYSKIIVITDDVVAKIYQKEFLSIVPSADFIIIKHGESAKSFENLQKICEEILQKNIDRKTLLIALGGGVVGDFTGFCASILLRGLDFIQIPTTLLAMIDSSVGGKTAINSKSGKNLIGSFYQPKLVICDINFLNSLPDREFKAGYAEIVKYGFIFDESFFYFLDKNLDKIFDKNQQILEQIIAKSCEIKAQIVGRDEKEQGERAILNFGHTFGHVLEIETNYSAELIHGEAVAIGMILASELSMNLGLIDETTYQKIFDHLSRCGFKLKLQDIRKNWQIENLINHFFKDKKTEHNQLNFIVLNKIGFAKIYKNISIKIINDLLKKHLD